VYYKTSHDADKDAYIIAKSEDEAKAYYGEGNYRAETDTFDTWFSSGQWPYATLMSTGDFDQFYPTSLMGTARDILHKWVTRMIMFSLYKTGKIPFEDVYLWGMVTDEQGQKLSKSKGNYDDPMNITAEYGTDALRLALSIGVTPGVGGKLSNEKIRGYRNFCNKVWNVSRFILGKVGEDYSPAPLQLQTPADHWLATELNAAIEGVTDKLAKYQFSEAGMQLYSLLWDILADQYLEYSKEYPNADMLVYALETVLRLLHPYAPFVTEAVWQQLSWTNSNLITEQWPNATLKPDAKKAEEFGLQIIDIVSSKQKDAAATKVAKLQREIDDKERLIKITEAKLSNQQFMDHAPQQVVDHQQKLLASTQNTLQQLRAELDETKQ
jgi:valyl-tRNA synthetase